MGSNHIWQSQTLSVEQLADSNHPTVHGGSRQLDPSLLFKNRALAIDRTWSAYLLTTVSMTTRLSP